MSLYGSFKYGTGTLYGTTAGVDAVSPETGSSKGGDDFIIKGSGFDPRQWDDLFDGGSLDTAKWTDISSGTGSVSTGAFRLQLDTGATAGSVAGIESTQTWGNTQGEIRVVVPRFDTFPTTEVVLSALTLYVDANNYAVAKLTMGKSLATLNLVCEVYRGGALKDSKTFENWTRGLSVIKILRFDSVLWFIVNGSVVMRSAQFIQDAATFRISNANQAAAYDVQGVRIEHFYYRPYAVFGKEPVHDTVVVSDKRVRGIVPPSRDSRYRGAAYAGLVDVGVVGVAYGAKVDAFDYFFEGALNIINSVQSGVKMSMISDDQIKTPDGETKGLGGGK